MWQRTQNNGIIILVFIFFIYPFISANPDIIIQQPFYLRARVVDSQTANVLFEIALEKNQRTCQMYKFTISRNKEYPYSMPEQNLTFWRNSLELKHLAEGHYNVCAVICSEHLPKVKDHNHSHNKTNDTKSITTCVSFRTYRSHFLILTLYILVLIFLTISQIIFSLRKRQFQARMKVALIEVENTVQKWRTAQPPPLPDSLPSCTILQSLVTLPATPVDYSVLPSPPPQTNDEDQHPIIFHLEIPTDRHGSM